MEERPPELPVQAETRKRHFRHLSAWAVLFVLVSIGAVVALGLLRQSRTARQATQLEGSEKEGRRVEVAEIKRSPTERELLLTGESRPFYSVTLLARVSGYMTQLKVDIGDAVKKGQLLARVESPETEQAYNSARADAINKLRIARRQRILLKRKLISQQEADQAFAASDVAEANLETQKVFRQYQNVIAPFDGRITQRFVDPGALIQNASNSPASQPLFTISQTNRLRIFVYVDQKDASFVKQGDRVEISLPNRPDFRFIGEVAQLAGELDPKTRTLLTEVHLDNGDQKIVAGSFVQVRMRITTPSYLEAPVQALVMKGNDAFVPVVDPNGMLRYTKIDLVENDGKNLMIRSGVREGERVALSVGSSLHDGQRVQPVQARPQTAAGQAGPGPSPSPRET